MTSPWAPEVSRMEKDTNNKHVIVCTLWVLLDVVGGLVLLGMHLSCFEFIWCRLQQLLAESSNPRGDIEGNQTRIILNQKKLSSVICGIQ
eukprot:s670_g30.t1